MNKTKSKKNCSQNITDVTEDFDYSGQSDEYITLYKKWRKNPDNPYAYNYIKNNREITFSANEGFINTRPQDKEHEVLTKILYTFGTVMILYLFIEYVVSAVLVEILDFAGLNIHNSFLNYGIYGSQADVMIVMIIITLLKFCMPSLILIKTFKMPLKCALPYKLQSSGNMFFCMALSLLASVLTSISRAYSDSTREYFRFFNGYNSEISLLNQSELVIYMFFDIVIFSIISEFLFRGAIFQALRQFGDLYAVTLTAAFSAIVTHDFASMPAAFAVSFIAGLSILRSGTMFTAVLVQIINKIYAFSLTIIELSSSDMLLKRSYFMIICFLISLAAVSILWNTMGKKITLKKNLYTFLTTSQKISLVFKTLTTFTVIFLCLIIILA